MIHRSEENPEEGRGFAVSKGYATDNEAKTHWSYGFRRSDQSNTVRGQDRRSVSCRVAKCD
jgi:hypothetical protein